MTDPPRAVGEETPLEERIEAYFRKPNLWHDNKMEANALLRAALAQLTLTQTDRDELDRTARDLLDNARQQVEAREGTLAMTVARLGGIVEGAPTHRINFLQRIDQLVATEQAYDEQRRDIDALLTVHRKALARAEAAEQQVKDMTAQSKETP